MKIKSDEVLVPAHDHSYIIGRVREGVAVWNKKYHTWSEYAGEEYLEDGDVVVDVRIAE